METKVIIDIALTVLSVIAMLGSVGQAIMVADLKTVMGYIYLSTNMQLGNVWWYVQAAFGYGVTAVAVWYFELWYFGVTCVIMTLLTVVCYPLGRHYARTLNLSF